MKWYGAKGKTDEKCSTLDLGRQRDLVRLLDLFTFPSVCYRVSTMEPEALTIHPEAASSARSLFQELGSNVCTKEAKAGMLFYNKYLYFVIDNLIRYSKFAPGLLASDTEAKEGVWVGASLAQLALRCNQSSGMPLVNPFTILSASSRLARHGGVFEQYIAALSSEQELTAIINHETSQLEIINPELVQFVKIGAGCVYFYSNEQYQQNQIARWN